MPIIKKPKKIVIPDNLVPFSKMEKQISKPLLCVNMKTIKNSKIF